MPSVMAALPNIGGALFNAGKFGWRPLLQCRAVTLPRRETRWNYLGCPKLTKRSQPIVGRSSLHCVSKNVPPSACYNFVTCERISIFFLAGMLPIKYAIRRRFTMPPPITCASALPGKMGKHENHIFHSNDALVHYLNSTSCWNSSIFLTHDLLTLLWLPKACNQCVQLGLLVALFKNKRIRKRCRSWTVLHAQCTSVLSSGFPFS